MLNLLVAMALLAPGQGFACWAECVGSKEACRREIEKGQREQIRQMAASRQQACVGKKAGVGETFGVSTLGSTQVSCTGHSTGCFTWLRDDMGRPMNQKFPLGAESGCSDITGTTTASEEQQVTDSIAGGGPLTSSLGGTETTAPTIEITVAHP